MRNATESLQSPLPLLSNFHYSTPIYYLPTTLFFESFPLYAFRTVFTRNNLQQKKCDCFCGRIKSKGLNLKSRYSTDIEVVALRFKSSAAIVYQYTTLHHYFRLKTSRMQHLFYSIIQFFLLFVKCYLLHYVQCN